MRDTPYAGPNDTNDFDELSPDEAAKLLNSYRLLGDCFELSDDADMMGRGWLIEDWRSLLEGHQEKHERAERELKAAVKLALNEGGDWHEIGEALNLTASEARARFEDPAQKDQ
ncbi:hypothetical protein GCM10009784_15200 [Arthrobacter parietis]|uniref:Helix-turn-helix DNA binding domain protein n=2 Tax=Arthrobacter TaxID=1663 RepID=A0ABT6CXC9_9MICC|nr:hypothetical protein [Arthrobacter vasquezii]MDF9278570.1 hypothetical protein [Arthrobacter vasquezii]